MEKLTNSFKENIEMLLEAAEKNRKLRTLEAYMQMHFASYLSQLPNKKLVFTNYDDVDKQKNGSDYFGEYFDYSRNNIYNKVYNETLTPLLDEYNLRKRYYYEFSFDFKMNKIFLRYSESERTSERKNSYTFMVGDDYLYNFMNTTYYHFAVKNYYQDAENRFSDIKLSAYPITLRPYFIQPIDSNQHFQKTLPKVKNPELFVKNYMYINFIVNEIENRFARMKQKTEIPRYVYPYLHYEDEKAYPSSNLFIQSEQEVLGNVEPNNPAFDTTFEFNYVSSEDFYYLMQVSINRHETTLIITNPTRLAKEIFDYEISEGELTRYSILSNIKFSQSGMLKCDIYLIEDDKSLHNYTRQKSTYQEPNIIMVKNYTFRKHFNHDDDYILNFFMKGGLRLNSDNKTINVLDQYSLPIFNYHLNLLMEQRKTYNNSLKDGTEHLLLTNNIF